MLSRMRMLLVMFGLIAGLEAHAQTFDLANDFSPTANPNGVWTYGLRNSSGTFGQLPFTLTSSGVDFWYSPNPGPFPTLPQIAHNPTTSVVIFETAIVDAGAVTFHPGVDGTLAVARFTAPFAATYDFSAFFQDADTAANIATISILENGSQLLLQDLGVGTLSFTQTLSLAAGGTVDFQIGAGSNEYFNDNKRIGVTVTTISAPIPEPASFLLIAIGSAVLGLRRLRLRP